MEKLKVFVASSKEQIAIAKRVVALLRTAEALDVECWDEGAFLFSRTYIESLEAQLDEVDFAVVILTADDMANVREQTVILPRDNVIFELGLFTGRLTRDRCYFLVDRGSQTRIASDLAGVVPIEYSLEPDAGRFALETQVDRMLHDRILRVGLRRKTSPQDRQEQERLWHFSRRLCGHWWERMRSGDDDSSALSYVTCSLDPVTITPHLFGTAYGLNSTRIADWHSVSSCVVLSDREPPQLTYRWQGGPTQMTETFGGGASILFDDREQLSSGRGEFYDTDFSKLAGGTRVKHFGLYRAEPDEVLRMQNPKAARELIQLKLVELDGR